MFGRTSLQPQSQLGTSGSIWDSESYTTVQTVFSAHKPNPSCTIRLFLVLSGTAVRFTGTLQKLYKNSIVFILKRCKILLVFFFFVLHSSCISIISLKTHFSTPHPKCSCDCNCCFWPCYFLLINSEPNRHYFNISVGNLQQVYKTQFLLRYLVIPKEKKKGKKKKKFHRKKGYFM